MLRRTLSVSVSSLFAVTLAAGLPARSASADDLVSEAIRDATRTLAKSKDARERADAAGRLGTWKVPAVVPPLITALGDPSPDVREEAARSLWKVKEVAEPARPALQTALADPEAGVAVAAAGALAAMGTPEAEMKSTFERGLQTGRTALPPLLEYLREQQTAGNGSLQNVDMARKALAELADTEDPALAAALLEALHSPEAVVRKAILEASREETHAQRLLPALKGLIATDPDAGVRQAAVYVAGQLSAPPKDLMAAIQKAMSDPDPNVRTAAARELNRTQGAAVSRRIQAAKGVEEVNAALAEAGSGPVAALAATLRSGATEQERAQAAAALSEMTVAADKAAPVLAEAVVNDASARVRFRAASGLVALPNVPDSQLAVVNPEEAVRDQAKSSLADVKR